MLVVMSTADNTGSSLVLVASPMAKKTLGISNVSRAYEVDQSYPGLLIVPLEWNLYIERNMEINNIFRNYVADEDLLIYSIDETILDVTKTLNLFFPSPTLSRSEKRKLMAKKIQQHVYNQMGLFVTVGAGDNPLLAKLALDNESKHTRDLYAEWTYQDVQDKVWNIHPITEFWGIGNRMKKQLQRCGIENTRHLAEANPWLLNERLGVMGLQLYHHAWGIDRTIISEPAPRTQEKSYGNSQVLPRDYMKQHEVELVLKEMVEQVATRIRRHH